MGEGDVSTGAQIKSATLRTLSNSRPTRRAYHVTSDRSALPLVDVVPRDLHNAGICLPFLTGCMNHIKMHRK